MPEIADWQWQNMTKAITSFCATTMLAKNGNDHGKAMSDVDNGCAAAACPPEEKTIESLRNWVARAARWALVVLEQKDNHAPSNN